MTSKQAVESAYKIEKIAKEMGFKQAHVIFSEDGVDGWCWDLDELINYRGEEGEFSFSMNIALSGDFSAKVISKDDELILDNEL